MERASSSADVKGVSQDCIQDGLNTTLYNDEHSEEEIVSEASDFSDLGDHFSDLDYEFDDDEERSESDDSQDDDEDSVLPEKRQCLASLSVVKQEDSGQGSPQISVVKQEDSGQGSLQTSVVKQEDSGQGSLQTSVVKQEDSGQGSPQTSVVQQENCGQGSPQTEPCISEEFYKAPSGLHWSSEVPPAELFPLIIEKNAPGPRNLGEASTKMELLQLFLPSEMLRKILQYTNEEGLRKRGKLWVNIVMTEFLSFLGLLYFLGLSKAGHESARSFWRAGPFARPFCQATMTGTRFQEVLVMLRFEDRTTRQQRRAKDEFAAIREVFEMFVSSCRNFFSPGECVTVGEQLVGFRGQCPFRQYMPQKSPKYGLKFWLSVDSNSHYVTNIQPYLGKVDKKKGMKLGMRVVTDLVQPLNNTGRNITTNKFFTSRELANHLLDKQLTLVGTVKENHRELPKNFKAAKVDDRDVKSSRFAFDGPLTLLSFIPKRKRNLLLISSMHHDDSIDQKTQNPDMVEFYNKTKKGVETVDQMCRQYSCARITKRWSLVVFFNLLNLAAINAEVLWCYLNPGGMTDRHDFLCDMIMELVGPQLEMRASRPCGLHRDTTSALRTLGYEVDYRRHPLRQEQRPGSRARPSGRCHLCSRKNVKRTTQICHTCRRYSCSEHAMKRVQIDCDVCMP